MKFAAILTTVVSIVYAIDDADKAVDPAMPEKPGPECFDHWSKYGYVENDCTKIWRGFRGWCNDQRDWSITEGNPFTKFAWICREVDDAYEYYDQYPMPKEPK